MKSSTKASTQTFWMAQMSTSHFGFRAFGATEASALSLLETGIREHCKRVEVDFDPEFWNLEDDVNVLEVSIGSCWRDDDQEIWHD